MSFWLVPMMLIFQPTLPARGATQDGRTPGRRTPYFNPRSPHGERPTERNTQLTALNISTHAPRTGSDAISSVGMQNTWNFNPRSPHGERPGVAGGRTRVHDFNPRSPHGERRIASGTSTILVLFQPTLPARGATAR